MSIPAHEQLSAALLETTQELRKTEAYVERLQSNLTQLFRLVGADGSNCKYCKKPIRWLRKPGFKPMVFDPDGTSHWATCPLVDQARRDVAARKKTQETK